MCAHFRRAAVRSRRRTLSAAGGRKRARQLPRSAANFRLPASSVCRQRRDTSTRCFVLGLPAQATAVGGDELPRELRRGDRDAWRNGGGDPNPLQTVPRISSSRATSCTSTISNYARRTALSSTLERRVAGAGLAPERQVALRASRARRWDRARRIGTTQMHQLGTLYYGATTAGAPRTRRIVPLSDHCGVHRDGPRDQSRDAHELEGVGVKLDHDVPLDDALREAHVAAVTSCLEHPADDDHRALLGCALERVKATASDPADDFCRWSPPLSAAEWKAEGPERDRSGSSWQSGGGGAGMARKSTSHEFPSSGLRCTSRRRGRLWRVSQVALAVEVRMVASGSGRARRARLRDRSRAAPRTQQRGVSLPPRKAVHGARRLHRHGNVAVHLAVVRSTPDHARPGIRFSNRHARRGQRGRSVGNERAAEASDADAEQRQLEARLLPRGARSARFLPVACSSACTTAGEGPRARGSARSVNSTGNETSMVCSRSVYTLRVHDHREQQQGG